MATMVPTVKVTIKSNGKPAIIREVDYDPELHDKAKAEKKAAAAKPEPEAEAPPRSRRRK